MQKKCLLAIAAGIATLAVSSAAQAQVAATTEPVVRPFSVKIGGFFPSNSNARSLGQKTKLMIGLDDAIGKSTNNSPTLGSVYFDFVGDAKSGSHVNTYGLGYSLRAFSSPVGTGSGPAAYFGGGVGIYYVDVKPNAAPLILDARVVGANGISSTKKFTVGGKIFGGVEAKSGLFAEATYQILGSQGGVNPSGIGVELGQRF